jgi:hypothetical protein
MYPTGGAIVSMDNPCSYLRNTNALDDFVQGKASITYHGYVVHANPVATVRMYICWDTHEHVLEAVVHNAYQRD